MEIYLIYWYLDTDERGKIVDFMIENLEDESQWVVSKKRHLKNRKKHDCVIATQEAYDNTFGLNRPTAY